MKTYEEMTEAVLLQAKQRRIRHRKKVISALTIASSVCAVFVAVAMIVLHNAPPVYREPRLLLVASAAAYEQQEELVEGVVTPLKFLIRVRDIRGISRERDVIDIIGEEMIFRENVWNEETEDGIKHDSSCVRWQNENAIISLICKGFLYLRVDEYEQIQAMSVKTTLSGQATVTPYFHNDGAENIRRGIHINWSLSQTTVERINSDPTLKLSSIMDTITVDVEFKDGTTETVTIDLTVDDEGQIYVTHKGTTVIG